MGAGSLVDTGPGAASGVRPPIAPEAPDPSGADGQDVESETQDRG